MPKMFGTKNRGRTLPLTPSAPQSNHHTSQGPLGGTFAETHRRCGKSWIENSIDLGLLFFFSLFVNGVRCWVIPHPGHIKARRSSPTTGMLTSSITLINTISPPQALQRASAVAHRSAMIASIKNQCRRSGAWLQR